MRKENARSKFIILLFLIALPILCLNIAGKGSFGNISTSKYIAKLKIHGIISESTVNEKLIKTTARLEKDKRVAAVLIEIDSPGGTVYSSEVLYKNLRRLSTAKTTIAIVKNYAASGGYMAAVACDKIFALNSSVVGSIGAVEINLNISKLLDKVGVHYDVIRSGEHKFYPNPWEVTPPNAREREKQLIITDAKDFANLVMTRRNLTKEEISKIADGRKIFGKDALSKKLIDGIADERDVFDMLIDWNLASKKTKIIDVTPGKKQQRNGCVKQITNKIGTSITENIMKSI